MFLVFALIWAKNGVFLWKKRRFDVFFSPTDMRCLKTRFLHVCFHEGIMHQRKFLWWYMYCQKSKRIVKCSLNCYSICARKKQNLLILNCIKNDVILREKKIPPKKVKCLIFVVLFFCFLRAQVDCLAKILF